MTSGQSEPVQDSDRGPVRADLPESPEQAVIRLQAELAFVKKQLQVVGSVTRHDAMNQMTAVMGYNELLLSMIEDEKIRKFLEIEQKASDKMRRIFAYSKVFQLMGAEPPRWQKLDALLHLAVDEAELRSVPVRQETGEVSLFADPQIYKVFAYLLDNAVRHGKKTTAIRLALEPGGPAPVLIVEDDGTGVAYGDKEKIFEHGFGKYTGWGLFVARAILSVNGMAILEKGTPGSGARFEITIPKERIRVG